MGCCQGSSTESEVLEEKNCPDIGKPLHLVNTPSDSEQKIEATPSFGTGKRNFIFESKEKESLEIN